MVWAKVVNDEVMQIFEDDPTNLWHPDALEFWKQVPDYVGEGWKFKNGKWISGGQWLEEFQAENPVPPPGPPTAGMIKTIINTETTSKLQLELQAAGSYDEFEWEINGKKYKDELVELEFQKTDKKQIIPVSLTVRGPGGEDTKVLEGDEAVVINAAILPV